MRKPKDIQKESHTGRSSARRYLLSLSILILPFLISLSCQRMKTDPYAVDLRWVPSYKGETWDKVKTGLYWSLSLLGAEADSSVEKELITKADSVHFTLHLNKAGFSSAALETFSELISKLEDSEEYRAEKCIDLGRFLVICEHISEHYYAITGVCRDLKTFRKKYHLEDAPSFQLFRSCVAKNPRTIRIYNGGTYDKIAFIAEEHLSSDPNSFVVAYEVFDVMKNGQLRFAVYDDNGDLMSASPVKDGAGKPSKCMWCHESMVQPLFFATTEPSSGMSVAEFGKCVDSAQHVIDAYRRSIPSLVHYEHRQDHAFGEDLYVGFMQPTVFRMMNEWNTDSLTVRKRFKGLPTHADAEYPFFGQQWYRHYADSLAPYTSLKVPLSVREFYPAEQTYLSDSKKIIR